MTIKLCQIGLGYWGKNLVRNLNTLGALATAYDLDEEVVAKYKKDSVYRDVEFGADYTECLDRWDVQGVVIATPPSSHYQIALTCLNKNKHVFIEKPMTLVAEESEALVKLAKEKNLILSVGHIFLYSPEIIKLKEVIDSDAFGDVQYIYTQRLNLGKVQNSGVIMDLAPHDISIVDYLLGSVCEETKTTAKGHLVPEIDDVAFISMRYPNDITAQLHLSWLDPLKVRTTTVVGSHQMAVCCSGSKKIDIYNTSVNVEERSNISNKSYADHLFSYTYGDVVSPYIETAEPMRLELADFIGCIESGGVPVASGEVGSSVVKTLTAMLSSHNNGGGWEKV